MSCCVIFLALMAVTTELPAHTFLRRGLNFSEKFKYIQIRIIFPALDHKYLLKKIDDRDLPRNLFSIYCFQTTKLVL